MNDYNAPRHLAVLFAVALLAACAHGPKKPAPQAAAAAPQAATVSAPSTASAPPAAAPTILNTAPKQYTVKKGDTLWGIATLYLKNAWDWPDIWYANPAIKNPHLIYPGDVLILGYNQAGQPSLSVERNGQVVSESTPPPTQESEAPTAEAPAAVTVAAVAAATVAPKQEAEQEVVMNNLPVTKLGPQVRYLPLDQAITTVNLDGLRPFLSKTRIVTKSQMDDAGYIMQAMDYQPAIGVGIPVYARKLKPADGTRYGIYHLGSAYIDPENGHTLGYEATYVGEAQVTAWGDPQKVDILSSTMEARVGDRFLAQTGNGSVDLSFQPHAPAKTVSGQIAAVLSGEGEVGQFDVVLLNRGTKDGVDPGTVLGVYRKGGTPDDPNNSVWNASAKLPEERSGTLLVFRSFDDSSYAVIMVATREIHVADVAANP